MKLTFKPTSTDGQMAILLGEEQIGTIFRTQNGFFCDMHGDWAGLRAKGASLPACKDNLAAKVAYARGHARNVLANVQKGNSTVRGHKVAFSELSGVDTSKMTNEKFLKFCEKYAKKL